MDTTSQTVSTRFGLVLSILVVVGMAPPVWAQAVGASASTSGSSAAVVSAAASATSTPADVAPPAASSAKAPAGAAATSPASSPQTGPVPTHDRSLRVDPLSLDFAKQRVGSSSGGKTILVTVDDAKTRTYSDIRVGGDFLVSPAKCEAGSCALTVVFAPKHRGPSESAVVATEGSASGVSRALAVVRGEGTSVCDSDVLACGVGLTLLLVLIYVVALIAVRWNMIALPSRRLLHGEIEAVQARVEALKESAGDLPALAQAARMLEAATKAVPLSKFDDMKIEAIFWSRGQEICAWGLLHEAEELLVAALPPEALKTGLERSVAELNDEGGASARLLAESIQAALTERSTPFNDTALSAIGEVDAYLARLIAALEPTLAAVRATPGTPSAAQLETLADIIDMQLAQQSATLQKCIADVIVSAGSSPSTPPVPAGFRALLERTRDVVLLPGSQVAHDLRWVATDTDPPPTAALLASAFARADATLLTPVRTLATQTGAALAGAHAYPLDRWRALLTEALGHLYDQKDTKFSTLISWHSKTMWLIGCILLVVVSLAIALDNGLLFLFGATGGLLSRLSRTLYREDVRTDYGASWTTLFLSPAVGALTGWGGVLLVAVAVQLGLLGSLFTSVTWDSSFNLLAFGLAIVFGFSERAFDTILSSIESKLVGPGTAEPKPAAPEPLRITTAPALTASVGKDPGITLRASGGAPPYEWSITNGTPPAGLKVDATGRFVGQATAIGTATFTVQVKDSGKATDSRELTLKVT